MCFLQLNIAKMYLLRVLSLMWELGSVGEDEYVQGGVGGGGDIGPTAGGIRAFQGTFTSYYYYYYYY